MDAEQAEDVWAWAAEECAWVKARLDVGRDHVCGVRTEVDAAHGGTVAARAGSAKALGGEDEAENLADTMGAGMEIVIDRREYLKNNCCE